MAATNKKSWTKFILLVILMIAAVISVVSLVVDYVDISAKRDQLAKLQPQIDVLQQSVNELNNLLENGTQENIIEKAARDKLGYVYSDEQIYVNLTPGN